MNIEKTIRCYIKTLKQVLDERKEVQNHLTLDKKDEFIRNIETYSNECRNNYLFLNFEIFIWDLIKT